MYDPKPLQIVCINGSMITAKCGRKEVTRNASHFKKVNDKLPTNQYPESSDDEIDEGPQATVLPEQNIVTVPRRSDRTRIMPERYAQFVMGQP